MVILGGAHTPLPSPKSTGYVLAITLHTAGFREDAAAIRALVARLTVGAATLAGTPRDHELREWYEDSWQQLATEAYDLHRSAYFRIHLLRNGMGNEAASALWQEHMPGLAEYEAAHVRKWFAYWPERTEPPQSITWEETRHLRRICFTASELYDDDLNGLITAIAPPF